MLLYLKEFVGPVFADVWRVRAAVFAPLAGTDGLHESIRQLSPARTAQDTSRNLFRGTIRENTTLDCWTKKDTSAQIMSSHDRNTARMMWPNSILVSTTVIFSTTSIRLSPTHGGGYTRMPRRRGKHPALPENSVVSTAPLRARFSRQFFF